jgi:hypothetical protein
VEERLSLSVDGHVIVLRRYDSTALYTRVMFRSDRRSMLGFRSTVETK